MVIMLIRRVVSCSITFLRFSIADFCALLMRASPRWWKGVFDQLSVISIYVYGQIQIIIDFAYMENMDMFYQ